MRGLFTNQRHILQAGQVVSGTTSGRETLRVTHGRLWVTIEGIDHDYFLHAGDSFTPVPGRLTVIEAERDAGLEWQRRDRLQKLRAIAPPLANLLRAVMPAPAVQASLQRHVCSHEGCC